MKNEIPLLSTSEPSFMGALGDVYHMHLADDKSVYESDKRVVVYIDGDLQDEMGYDVPYLLSGHMTGVDGQECKLITPDGRYLKGHFNRQVDDDRDLFYVQTERSK